MLILLRVGHKNFAIEISDAERAVPSGKVRVNEPIGIHLMKILIVSLDLPPVKVCYVEKIVTVADAERCTFVNSVVAPVAVIDGDNGVRLIQRRVPSRDGTVFADKNEQSRKPKFHSL